MNKASLFLFALLLLAACGKKPATGDWLEADNVRIACDETLRPILEEQFLQFGKSHIEAEMQPLFCSEDNALRLLLADTLRSIVATRPLSKQEQERVKAHHLGVSQTLIASDAFALIVSKNNPDTAITLSEVRDIVSGRITRWEQIGGAKKTGELKLVFDHSGSSTVRYMRDSLCAGQELRGNIYAQGSNPAVIEAVRSNPAAIGVVGTDWLRGEGQQALNSFAGLDVSVMLVQKDKEHVHCRPFQYYIGTGDYPLVRSVYAITTDPRTRSQEKYLFFWLKGQKGQTIFCNNSQLLPAMRVQVKDITIK